MANLKIALTADTSQAVRGLNQVKAGLQGVEKQAESTDAGFGKLKTTLAGLATGVFTASAFKMAQGLNDISKATGIALQNVVGFSQAIQANGGTIDRARDGLSDFTKNIAEAARGQKELQDALAASGVSLRDLATLSEQDLLAKTIQGLSRIPDAATRSATAMKLFGESMKGVDLQGVAAGLGAFTANAGPNAEAIRAAGEASANFQKVMTDVQIKLLATLKPLSDLAVKMLDAGSAIGKFVDLAIEIGKIVLVFTAISRAAALLRSGIALLAEGWKAIVQAVQGLSRTFGSFVTQLKAIWREGAITSKTFEALGKRFQYLSQELPLLSKGLAILGTAFYAAYAAAKKFFGGTDTKGIKEAADAAKKLAEQQAEAAKKLADQQAAEQLRKVTEAAAAAEQAKAKALRDTVRGYQESAEAQLNNLRIANQSINASEEQRNLTEALQQAEQNYYNTVKNLNEQLAKAKLDAAGKESEAVNKIIAELERLDKAYLANGKAIRDLIAEQEKLTRTRQLDQFTIGQEVKAQTELRKIQDDIAKSSMSDIERKYYDIAAAARESAMAAIAAEEARRGELLTQEERQKFLEAANKRTQELIKKQRESYDQSRRFETGWERAFKSYRDDATNAARQAENIFRKATQGMEDAIVNFAKTGKFEWKSFVSSILEEMLRAQIQQLIAATFSTDIFGGKKKGGGLSLGGGGGGGFGLGDIIGGVGSLFGLGGSSSKKQPSVISGGGIGGGLSGITGSLSKVVDAGKSIVTGIGNTVGSVVKGIGDFFGGFFANGGTLGAGKWGIAGEAGPELISGPANITPLSGMGGVTNVVYNISAVDAMSFQQLVARDPQFIFAVTEAGRKSLPGGRR